ncbi:MAG: PCMD domain-containing protein [Bacteroidia bacterium]|jgi:hypothetical protein|nr:PCMD domain-containing protein [Bacteroidia bacterium]
MGTFKVNQFIGIISIALFSGCVNENYFGASAEKKILAFTLTNQTGNTNIIEASKTIRVKVSADAMLAALKPTQITLSTFAKIAPAIDITRDFSNPVAYTVTAEDGTTETYMVVVEQEGANPQLENSSFDQWYTTPKGYEEPGENASSIWATGNAGVVTLGDANVTPFTINGIDRAAKLVTADLGSLAGLVGQRMGAGSMFTGKFELDIANPLNSTKFGISYSAKPKQFSVNYAYAPGTPYLDKDGQVLSKTDSCDIYVLLENRESGEAKRVATGWFRSGKKEIDAFKTVTVDLWYGTLPNDVPAYQKPTNGLYANSNEKATHITVVFSSSYNGAFFEGGTNSTLVVNNFALIY